MESFLFSDFQKEVKEKGFKNPRITFGLNSITIASLPFFNDIVGQLFLWFVATTLCIHSTYLFFGIITFAASLYFFYFHFIGLNILLINCSTKTINIRNRIFFFNILRKLFGINTEIKFSDVKEISCKEGLLLNRFSNSSYNTRELLLIESFSDPAITVSQFKKEDEAKIMATLLKKFVLSKEENIA